MTVSVSKSKILSPSNNLVCVLADLITGVSDSLELVSNYKYLRVGQHRSSRITSKAWENQWSPRHVLSRTLSLDHLLALLTGYWRCLLSGIMLQGQQL